MAGRGRRRCRRQASRYGRSGLAALLEKPCESRHSSFCCPARTPSGLSRDSIAGGRRLAHGKAVPASFSWLPLPSPLRLRLVSAAAWLALIGDEYVYGKRVVDHVRAVARVMLVR